MRDTIIKIFDVLIWVIGAITAIGGIIAGIVVLAQGEVVGLGFIIGGILYAVIIMALFFIQIGIYYHTKRTAEAVEKLAGR
ncbi:hypothetical protein KUV47_17000 [Vannielia litorea]|uniref:hypothetical protein n=1 Tax=Vannielia TaxID=2813041 RepID=UPI001C973BE3|nr:hypothetical protein [Vannielia litorea]MBY6049272.1 hypothetical protein [Vannielia litorea]MBY6076686.1 hypothetical protein [Vannielia litorea]MBY6154923.1 hypothetical protein [Vannielia litorea]